MTGRECAAMAPSIGGWLTRISAKVPANKKVGHVLSEAEVRKLYNKKK